ncbi:MAG: BlaI/MecI/CopY family transcriptional regulator [Candidatus Marinimicrobia bacterium]|nr:BlaI/MecI/CopY family transcriptional regulator [Candidatus Neomarinimicrobiota bacterium]
MKNNNSLTKFEWEIMKVIWTTKNISAREVLEKLSKKNQRAYTTIQTYLERLTKKRFLKKEKIGLVNFYSPIVKKEKALRSETNDFVEKLFHGSYSQMAAFLFDTNSLKEKDFMEIKKMIKKRGAK